jgi:hypothetical protein
VKRGDEALLDWKRRDRSDRCVWREVKSHHTCLEVCGSVMCIALSRSEGRRVAFYRVSGHGVCL